MIDGLTPLAFSVYSGRGVYALLLGSGVSRAAEIPTGWEISLDLIRKVAAIEREDCEPDPAQWYSRRFGHEPDYSALLEKMAVTQAERTNALRAYFEATVEERESGKKIPTLAHKAIARLVAKNYIRVIITTNFDRLIEQALEAESISPTVISTPDMAHGAAPLAHSRCTVIKVHGDYRDTRLKNTTEELSAYDPEIDKLLDRVFDEYGLIICGWSATWDAALRSALLRSASRRYSVTWATRGTLSPEAKSLIAFRHASVLEIESADRFLSSLAEKVDALERFSAPHPLSTAIATASLKKFIVEDHFRIEMRELVMGEVERQVAALSPLSVQMPTVPCEVFLARVKLYENSMEMLLALIASGCYWGTVSQAELWLEAISRMVDISPPTGGNPPLVDLRRYPACMLLYVGGIAALAARKYGTVRVLMKEGRTSIDIGVDGRDDFLIRKLVLARVLSSKALNQCSGGQQVKTPSSDRLHVNLRNTLRSFLPNDLDYDNAFDRFEYLFSLVYLDDQERDGDNRWAPWGRYVWRNRFIGASHSHVAEILLAESKSQKSEWAPIKHRLFESIQRFWDVEEDFRQNILSKIEPY